MLIVYPKKKEKPLVLDCFPFKALGYIGHHILKLNQWTNINKMKFLYRVNEDTVRLFDAVLGKKESITTQLYGFLSLQWHSTTRGGSCPKEVDSLKLNAPFFIDANECERCAFGGNKLSHY